MVSPVWDREPPEAYPGLFYENAGENRLVFLQQSAVRAL